MNPWSWAYIDYARLPAQKSQCVFWRYESYITFMFPRETVRAKAFESLGTAAIHANLSTRSTSLVWAGSDWMAKRQWAIISQELYYDNQVPLCLLCCCTSCLCATTHFLPKIAILPQHPHDAQKSKDVIEPQFKTY